MKKNDKLELTIEDLTYEGLGVAKVDGYPLFLENALPGERVRAHVLKVGKKFGYAKVEDWLVTSPDRVAITDPNGTRVGTMPLQHMTYDAQLAFKQQQVKHVMTTIAKLPDLEVRPTLGMSHPYGYRNKAQIPVRSVHGLLTTGFFKKNSHDLVPMEDFHIQDPVIDKVVVQVRDILREYGVKPYNEEAHTGNLRHIIVRRGLRTGEVMVILVTRTAKLFPQVKIVDDMVREIEGLVSIVQNVQPNRSNVIMGQETMVLYGEDRYHEVLMGLDFAISSRSFFQVNTVQTEVLYGEAMKAASLTGGEIVVDAYCGIGTMSLAFAREAREVYAMEIVPDAIAMARENAAANGIANVTFEVGAAEVIMPRWVEEGLAPDVIVVDPPRKGLDLAFIEAAAATQARKIVYVSCNPATLARDIALFEERGYTAQYAQPVDMFPMTTAIETVAVMVRR